jgi:hypothetical protein
MDERDFSSEHEYFEGERADGRPLKYPSREMYKDPTKPDSKEPLEPPVVAAKPDARDLQGRYIRYKAKRS